MPSSSLSFFSIWDIINSRGDFNALCPKKRIEITRGTSLECVYFFTFFACHACRILFESADDKGKVFDVYYVFAQIELPDMILLC